MKRFFGKEIDAEELQGVGGWLWLPVAALVYVIFVGLRTAVEGGAILFQEVIWQAFWRASGSHYLSWWGVVFIFLGIAQLAMMVVAAITLVTIFMKKSYVPALFISLYLLGFLLMTLDYFVAVFFLTDLTQRVAEQTLLESRKNLIGAAIGAIIWIPYFLKSKRVKNTFVQ